MGITTAGLSVFAANMTGSALATAIAIGSGTTAYVSGDTSLDNETDRANIITVDLTTPEEVTLTADWSPVDVSGLTMTEHGTMTTGSVMLNRDVLTGSIVMTGEEELQVQQTFKFFI